MRLNDLSTKALMPYPWEMLKLRVLGVMTGTSCDGLDGACIEVARDGGWAPRWSASAPYPLALRRRVLDAQLPEARHSLRQLLELHRDLGEWYGSALGRILGRQGHRGRPDAIANHGQTVAHFPAVKRMGMTLQLGDPTRIARATGLTVISLFRDGDMAAGGQGAPLVPLFHRMLARTLDPENHGVSIHNLGGISNLTCVSRSGRKVLAFDTGPGNIWIDAAAAKATSGRLRIDRGGALAARGAPDERAIERVLSHPFFSAPPPKSTGRDDFPFRLLLSATRARGPDLVATATQVTIESVARAYERHVLGAGIPLRRIFISGGGARNRTLMAGLRKRLAGLDVRTLTEAGFDGQLLEAQSFAYFGYLTLMGSPLGGLWTGCRGFGPPGHIVPGLNWKRLCSRLPALLGR